MPTLINKSSGATRFELPALNLNFGSITDGTNIPPPPDSPVRKVPTPPQTPPAKDITKDAVKESNDESKPASTNGNLAGTKRTADDAVPLSPAASSRQGSIRRLFSRTTLNNSYLEGQTSNGNLAVANGVRPTSQGGASSFMDERKSKRTSGWFRRIRTGDSSSSKRTSTLYEAAAPPTPTYKKPSGPPPPMIPELSDLEKDHGSLGDDLFKNIK